MFCQFCGITLADGTATCSGCGRQQHQPGAPAAAMANQVRTSSGDAVRALRMLAANPVGGLASAFTELGPERARNAGIALCLGFTLAATIGLTHGVQSWFGGFAAGLGGEGSFMKTLLALLIPPAALILAGHVFRRVLTAPTPDVAADVFTAGAALLPLGMAMLLSGFLGAANAEAVALLMLCAVCYHILLLYAGLTTVGGLSAAAGAPAVPLLIALAGWLSKIGITALLT